MQTRRRIALASLASLASLVIGAPALAADYPTYDELTKSLRALAAAHRGVCQLEPIGTSREGRVVHALRLAAPGDVDPDARPALLIVANLDGDRLVGSAVALEVAETILTRHAEGGESVSFLADRTLYVIPRVNPDGAERYFATVRDEHVRNLRPDDADRDGEQDEDPPNDLDGNGLITMMRVPKPDEADMMADPGEPRLDVAPDRDKGERATHVLYVEGIDDDDDGAYNEDAIGGVDLNANFMHGYEEHADGAGPHSISEPESRALIDFVLARQNIAVVVTYGRHDNLSKPPDGKGTLPPGTPKNIDPEDVGLYKTIGERFVGITGLKNVQSAPIDGSFHAWAYAQFGVPSFATPLWTRPEPAKKPEDAPAKKKAGDGNGDDDAKAAGDGAEADEDGGLTPSGVGDISQETLDELLEAAEAAGVEVTDEMKTQITPEQAEAFARQSGVKIRRVGQGEGDGAPSKGAKAKEEGAWLAYSDEQRDGEGFVEWTPFDHPQLGPVEIGGWAPYFRTNPPADEVPAIAEKQVEFVLDLVGRMPNVTLSAPEVTRLAPGLYEIETALVNDGYLPAGTAMAVRNRRARPYVVRLSAANEDIVAGQRVNKVWSVPGSGGRSEFRWIVRAPDGSDFVIEVYSAKYGSFEQSVRLEGGDR